MELTGRNEANCDWVQQGVSPWKHLPEVHSQSSLLDWDALQVALTRLDHSPQNFKASIGRSGALSNRRPPSRSSRASSCASRKSSSVDSIGRLEDFAGFDEDLVVPKVVNIDVRLEGGGVINTEKAKRKHIISQTKTEGRAVSKSVEDILLDFKASPTSTYQFSREGKKRTSHDFISSSTPFLNRRDSGSVSSEDILRNIKNTYCKEIKSEGYRTPDLGNSVSDLSLSSNRFPLATEEKYDNVDSSSEPDVVISDRESIEDSGFVNRRTVIKIRGKSRSASNIKNEETELEWGRNLVSRRSLRTPKELTKLKLFSERDLAGGINVQITSPECEENKRRDSISRMFVRQGDTENRPTRASAFNVRRTIEKRQIQQERRERKALREQIREHLRSFSEGRERKESSCSSGSSYQSSASVRSKSLNSLDQDQDDFRSESPLFKVQSSPTLESEKESVKSYLFGSNLSDTSPFRSSSLVSRIMSPTFSPFNKSESNKLSDEKYSLKNSYQFNESDHSSVNRHLNTNKEIYKERHSIFNKYFSRDIIVKDAVVDTSSEADLRNISYYNISSNKDTNNVSTNRTSDTEKYFDNSLSNINAESSTQSNENKVNNTIKGNQKFDEFSPIPPPRRRSRVSRSTGQLTVEKDEKPAWLRLAKERRSLRSPKSVADNFSDTVSSIVSPEPEWVTKARKKLESMNVCLTSTTDAISVNSQVTESSSAWSRGGLDALEDLREEVTRISEELAEEASERVERELGIADRNIPINMIEYHKISGSAEASAERQRVSFDNSAPQNEKPRKISLPQNLQKDEVRFGDLKHDWGGAQSKGHRLVNGKHKETRFGEVHFNENVEQSNQEDKIGKVVPAPKASTRIESIQSEPHLQNNDTNHTKVEPRPVMHFGDTPQDIFTKDTSKVKSQSSSKFESIAGPDPTKMTPEELNQNVEEYDFPIPTGKEDATDLINFLKESLNKQEAIPEFVSNEDSKPKPRSILKRKSIENVHLETKNEENIKSSEQTNSSEVSDEKSKIDEKIGLKVMELIANYKEEKKLRQNSECSSDLKVTPHQPTNNLSSFSDLIGAPNQSTNNLSSSKIYSFSFNPYQKQHSLISAKNVGEEAERLTEDRFTPTDKSYESKTPSGKTSVAFTNQDEMKLAKENEYIFEKNDDLVFHRAQKPKGDKVTRNDEHFGRRSLRETSSKAQKYHKRTSSSLFSAQEATDSIIGSSKHSNAQTPNVKVHQVSPEPKKKEIYHHKPREVNLEIVDTTRRSLPASLEKKKAKNSLFEWEAIQRQRIEDEEKNRINKSISIKPVSSKIKDLVKLHSGLMSMFSKDKKSEYNGTVDAKEEIFFQKIPFEKPRKITINKQFDDPMKSPYIVQHVLSPKLQKEKETFFKEREKLKPLLSLKPENIPSSLEREMYAFNQRNIYIDDDTIQRQRNKERKSHIENIQSLISQREKKYELNENKPCIQKWNLISEKKDPVVIATKRVDEPDLKQTKVDEIKKFPYKRKEWVNNMLNDLANGRSEHMDKNPIKIEDSIFGGDVRNSYYRRSFHDNLLRKNEHLTKATPAKKTSCDDQTGFLRLKQTESPFNNESPTILHEHKGHSRGPVNLTTIIGETSSLPSSNLSTPITSPRASPERRIVKDFPITSPILERQAFFENQGKENVCPTRANYSNKPDGLVAARLEEERNTEETHQVYDFGKATSPEQKSLSPSITLRNIIDRADPNRRSLTKLVMEWEERGKKERSASPASFSENNSVFNRSKDDYYDYQMPKRVERERSYSLRSASSVRSTPDRDSRPVSLSSILERDVSSPHSSSRRLSEELSESTQNYRREKAIKQLSKAETTIGKKDSFPELSKDSANSNLPSSSAQKRSHKDGAKYYPYSSRHSGSQKRRIKDHNKDLKKVYNTSKTIKKQVKESHIYNKNASEKDMKTKPKRDETKLTHQAKYSMKEQSKPKTKLVRRRSSLKKSHSGDSVTSSLKKDSRRDPKRNPKSTNRNEKVVVKTERKRRESDTASERYASIRHKPGGWTKTSIRKIKLGDEPPDKILLTKEKDKGSIQGKNFKVEASKELEKWAAGMEVKGKLVKKEGQKYSHHLEEEVEGGKKSSKAITHRIVRRGSRRLSAGGELMSETKEMTSSGDQLQKNEGNDSKETSLVPYTGGVEPPKRKIKSSTDGERYVTQSLTTEGGIQKFTTEGIDNKTTKSVEIIGGSGWEGERAVKGCHGERLIVEQRLGADGRPSTIVKKSTTQSKLIITKTKKKALVKSEHLNDCK